VLVARLARDAVGSGERPPRVLIYSAFADRALAVAAMVAGADGLLGKASLGDQMCFAIRRLASGRRHLPAINASVARAMRSRLDTGDQAISGMLVCGFDPAQIAEQLAITLHELDVRRSIMLRLLGLPPVPSGSAGAARAPLDYERP
jgi:DNA-binding NarL/FixJ family response regulator